MEKQDILKKIISIKSVLAYIDIKSSQYKSQKSNITNLEKEFNDSYKNNFNGIGEKVRKELDKVSRCEDRILKLEKVLNNLKEEKIKIEKSQMDYSFITNEQLKERMKSKILEEMDLNIQECNKALEKEKQKFEKYNDNANNVNLSEKKCIESLGELNSKMNKIISFKKKQNQIEGEKINLVYEKLCAQNIDFIHYKDFDKLDYIYFYIETGRASTIMDALNLVDLQIRHEELVNVLKQAVATICFAIKTTGDKICDEISKYSNVLCEELQGGFSKMDRSLDSLSSELDSMNIHLDSINKNQKEAISTHELTNSLIEEQNKTCEDMLKNYRYVNGLSGDL